MIFARKARLCSSITDILVGKRRAILNAKRYVFRYKVEVAGKSLPVLTNLDKGRYGVLIFENLNKYLQMDKWNRELLDKYCREYSVGIVGFAPPGEESLVGAQLKGFPLFIHTNLRLKVGIREERYSHTSIFDSKLLEIHGIHVNRTFARITMRHFTSSCATLSLDAQRSEGLQSRRPCRYRRYLSRYELLLTSLTLILY